MAIAFFDLDKTLIANNSASLWLKSQWKVREINTKQILKASYWLFVYHLGFTNMEKFIKESATFMKGEKKDYVLKRTEAFFKNTVKHHYRPGALLAIKKHRKNKDKICLLTSSFDGLSYLVQKDLKLDYCLCTKLEVDDEQKYTGLVVGNPCFGKHKLLCAQDLCKNLGEDLKKCIFYTDSASDIPLLNIVGMPVAVNPDPHLRTRAQMNKWPIVDWGKPKWFNKE